MFYEMITAKARHPLSLVTIVPSVNRKLIPRRLQPYEEALHIAVHRGVGDFAGRTCVRTGRERVVHRFIG